LIDPIALARKLIDIPSPTEEERAVGEFLDAEMSRYGFVTKRLHVTDSRFNLYASTGGRPRVVINSHIDTVPPWFASREDSANLYGRGACDTKGVIAAMIAAGLRLRERSIRDFAFLFVVGEETDSIGAKTANRELADLGSQYVLVGEPTQSKFARASKGALTVFVRFEGVAAHSAYPERGDSAIKKMLAAITAIEATDWGSHEILGNATVNVGVIRGGEKPNIVPGVAECEMMFRTVDDHEAVRAKLEQLLGRFGGKITMARGNPPQFMIVPEGAPSTVVAFNTDVPHLSKLGKPLLFGPGSILDAHGDHEYIAKRDLFDAIVVYCETVARLLGS